MPRPKGNYTADNVLEAIKIFAKYHYGHAPIFNKTKLPEECSLANNARTWININDALRYGHVVGAEKFRTLKAFCNHHGYNNPYPKFVTYTLDNMLEAMNIHAELNNGIAPTHLSGIIKGDCELANGERTWANAAAAFTEKNVLGTQITKMVLFGYKHGFTLKPIIGSIYTESNILLAMQEYADAHNGFAPSSHSGIVKGNSPIADGIRTWAYVHNNFYLGKVIGVDKNQTMQMFAAKNWFKLPPKTKTKLIQQTAPDITLRQVFFAVAEQAVKVIATRNVANDTAEIDLTDENLKKANFDELIGGESNSNPLVVYKYTWSMLKTAIKKGLIPEIDKDFCLTTYAVEVEDRLLNADLSVPTKSEIQDWAAPKLLKSA